MLMTFHSSNLLHLACDFKFKMCIIPFLFSLDFVVTFMTEFRLSIPFFSLCQIFSIKLLSRFAGKWTPIEEKRERTIVEDE